MDVSSGATAAANARARRRVQRKDNDSSANTNEDTISNSRPVTTSSLPTATSLSSSVVNPPSTNTSMKPSVVISANPTTQSALVGPRSTIVAPTNNTSITPATTRPATASFSLPTSNSVTSLSSVVNTPTPVVHPTAVDISKHPEFTTARRALAKARWRAAIAYVKRLINRTKELQNTESNHIRWRITLEQATKYQTALRRRKDEISRLKAEHATTVSKLSNQLAEQAKSLQLAQQSSLDRMNQSEAIAAAEKQRLLAAKEKEKAELLAVTEQERLNLLATKESERAALESEAVETITAQAQMAAETTTQLQLALAFTQEQLQMTVNQVYAMDEEIRKLRLNLDEATARGNEATAEAQAYHEQLLLVVENQKKREEEMANERKELIEHMNQQISELSKQPRYNPDDDDGNMDENTVKGLRTKLNELRILLTNAEAEAVASGHALAQRNAAFTEASTAWAIERANYEVQLGSGNYKLCLTQAMNDVRESVYHIVSAANDPGLVAPPPPMGDVSTFAPSDLLHDIQSGAAFFVSAMHRILKRATSTETTLSQKESHLRDNKKEIENLSSQIQDLQFELLSQKQALLHQYEQEQHAHIATQQILEDTRKQEEFLRKQLSETQTTLNDTVSRNELLTVQLGAAQSAHSDCGNRIQALEKARDSISAARDALAESSQANRDSLLEAKHNLEINLTSTQTKLSAVENELTNTQKLLQSRQEEIQDLTIKLQSVTNELNDSRLAHKDATDLGSRSSEAHAAEIARASKLEATIAELTNNLASLRSTHEQIVNSFSASQNDNAILQTKVEQKTEEIMTLKHDIQQLKEQDIQQLKDRLATVTMEYEGSRREIMTIDASLAATNMELSNAQEKVVNLTETRDQLQQLYQNSETERKAGEARISELRANISTLENQLTTLRTEYDAYRHDNAEIITLREKIEQGNNNIVLANETIKSITKEKDDINIELQRTVGELNAANTTIKQLRVEIGEIQTKIGAANHASELALAQVNKKHDEERITWTQELDQTRNLLGQKSTDYDTATKQIAELSEKLTQLESVHGVIRIAQTKADTVLQEANTKAHQIQEEAAKAAKVLQTKADSILEEANRTADSIKQKATTDAEALMRTTKDDVDRLYTVAQTEASSVLSEAAAKLDGAQGEADAIIAAANAAALVTRNKAEENAAAIVISSQEALEEAKQRANAIKEEATSVAAASQRAAMAAADRVIDLAQRQADDMKKQAQELLSEARIERMRVLGDAETEAVSVRKQAQYLLQQTALDVQESATGNENNVRVPSANVSTSKASTVSRTISFADTPVSRRVTVISPKPSVNKVSSSTAAVAHSKDAVMVQANEQVQIMLREAEEAAEAIVARAKRDSAAMREEAVKFATETAAKAKATVRNNNSVESLPTTTISSSTPNPKVSTTSPVSAAAAAITVDTSNTTDTTKTGIPDNITAAKAVILDMLRNAQADKEAMIHTAEQAALAIREEAEKAAAALLQRTAAEVDAMLQRARDRVRVIEQEGLKARNTQTPIATAVKGTASPGTLDPKLWADREVANKLETARVEADKITTAARKQAAEILRIARLQADSTISGMVAYNSKILATAENDGNGNK